MIHVVLVGSGEATEITIDSAAEESVCPEEWAMGFGTAKVVAGKEMRLVNASGGEIKHYGRRKVEVEASVF